MFLGLIILITSLLLWTIAWLPVPLRLLVLCTGMGAPPMAFDGGYAPFKPPLSRLLEPQPSTSQTISKNSLIPLYIFHPKFSNIKVPKNPQKIPGNPLVIYRYFFYTMCPYISVEILESIGQLNPF